MKSLTQLLASILLKTESMRLLEVPVVAVGSQSISFSLGHSNKLIGMLCSYFIPLDVTTFCFFFLIFKLVRQHFGIINFRDSINVFGQLKFEFPENNNHYNAKMNDHI